MQLDLLPNSNVKESGIRDFTDDSKAKTRNSLKPGATDGLRSQLIARELRIAPMSTSIRPLLAKMNGSSHSPRIEFFGTLSITVGSQPAVRNSVNMALPRRNLWKNLSLGKIQCSSVAKSRSSKTISVPLWLVAAATSLAVRNLVALLVLAKVKFPSWVQGGVASRSVKTNAKHHVRRPLLSTMDIKDCFPSITMHKVRGVFEELGFSGEALAVITKLTTWEFQLPQGAPTSPAIANLALAKIDRRQIGLAKQHGLTYTRYVDDIPCSGGERLRNVRNLQERIVVSEGFAIKPLKDGQKKIMRGDQDRQQLTGLVLNEKINLPREKRQAITQDAISAIRRGVPLTETQKGRVAWLHSVNPDLSTTARHAAKGMEKAK